MREFPSCALRLFDLRIKLKGVLKEDQKGGLVSADGQEKKEEEQQRMCPRIEGPYSSDFDCHRRACKLD